MQKENIAFLGRDRRELVTFLDMAAQSVRDGRVEALGMIIKKFHESYACQEEG